MAKQPDALEINRMQRELGERLRQRQAAENSPTFTRFASAWSNAQDEALLEAALVAKRTLRAKLARGYTTGEDVTGEAAGKVRVGKPETSRSKGYRYVRVYAKDFKQIFWEFGWFWTRNRRQMRGHTRRERRAFAKASGKFFRVTHWADTAREVGPAMAAAFHRVFDRALQRKAA